MVKKKAKTKKLTKNQQLLKDLSKKANQKMRALESHKTLTPALKQANEWLRENTDNRIRFSTNPAKMDYKSVQRELYAVKKFLSAKSSTITGHRQTVAARNKTFENRGIDKSILVSEDGKKQGKFYDFFKTALYYKLKGNLDSDQIVDLIAENKNIVSLDLDTITLKQKKMINDFFGKFPFDRKEFDGSNLYNNNSVQDDSETETMFNK